MPPIEQPAYSDDQKERGYYGSRRTEMLPFLPPSTRLLLDVGCGRGAFGATVKRILGARVWGIELNHEAARVATVRLDRVIEGDLHQAFATLPAGQFDCVTFNDILEHLVEPQLALTNVKRVLAPGGVVVASLPNIRYFPVLWDLLWRGNWEYGDRGVLDKTHLRFFAQQDMRLLFENCGYHVEQLVGINALQDRLKRWAGHLLPARFADIQYMQFAIVAKPR
jgi:2-polyprenyl-3-methyl-5-hydroxy-6-metoxy-1,4-benzoquinol methylase